MVKKKGPDIDATFKNILGLGADQPSEVKTPVADEQRSEDLPRAAPESGVFITAPKKESRSKRVNLLVTPSAYDAAKKKCDKLGISVNECINQFLEKWGNEN